MGCSEFDLKTLPKHECKDILNPVSYIKVNKDGLAKMYDKDDKLIGFAVIVNDLKEK